MKALILAGGRGNRINEISENQNKCMIPFKGRPLIEYNLKRVAALDISEMVIVVGYKAEDIINHYGNRFGDKRIRYVIQREQKGLVHALDCAREGLEGQDFFLMLGDEILIGSKEKEMIDFYRSCDGVFAVCGVLIAEKPDQICRTYTVVKDDRDTVFRLIEKPRRPINQYQGTGHCILSNGILDYIDITPLHHERHEKELPDLIQCCIDDGKLVKAFLLCDKYANVNSLEDLHAAEKLV
jgi:dTDP-glucose pyrophosphorylase